MLHGDFGKDWRPLKIKGNFWEAVKHKKAMFSSVRTPQRIDFIELNLAGAEGLEPSNGGIKIRCLTTWLRPKSRWDHTCRREADQSPDGR
jgi:hypothetical protein